jgi:O-antigen/teichoic acid export membrane protein
MAQVLLARNLQSYVTIATTVGAVVNFLGNIYILPRFGLIGSSWVTVCSYSLSSIFIFLFFNPTRIESWSGVIILLKLILIGLAGLILSTFLANSILMAVVIFLFIFGASVWVGKIITNSDLKLLLHAFSGG